MTNNVIPQAFIDYIQPQLPSHLSVEDLITACHQSLRFSIRVNTLKIDINEFVSLMEPLGWKFTAIPWCSEGFWVEISDNASSPGKLPEHLIGLFYIQEASSMLPPVALFNAINAPATFDNVLDLAAAPGSKTTQIAGLMNNNGLLIANEYSSSRIKALHSNLARLSVNNTLISHFDGSVHGDYLENSFDAILIDAPCSGEGTVRKDPDAFKNWSEDHLEEITLVQKNLIESAFKALKPGGQLVYSTCALNAAENQGVCEYLLQQFPLDAQIVSLSNLFPNATKATTPEGYLHIWPQIYDSEGFFVAKFTKLNQTSESSNPTFRSKFPFKKLSKKDNVTSLDFINIYLKPEMITDANLYQKDNEVWYFPVNSEQFIDRMRFVRHGIKLFDIKPKQRVISHEALTNFGQIQFELTREQLFEYLKGRDIATDVPASKGEVVLGYRGVCIGLGKWVGHKIKNKLPRHLVNDHVELT